MIKKSKMSLKRATALMTVFTLVLGSAVATDFTYNKDDGTAYADGLIVNGVAEDVTLPLATMPQIVTDGSVEYNLAGNAWYGISAGDGYWTLTDTNGKMDSNNQYFCWNNISASSLFTNVNDLSETCLCSLKGAIKPKNVAATTHNDIDSPAYGKLDNAYFYPINYSELKNIYTTIGKKLYANGRDNSLITRTCGDGKYFQAQPSSSGFSSSGYPTLSTNYYYILPTFDLDLSKVLITRKSEIPQSFGSYNASANIGNVIIAQSSTYNNSFSALLNGSEVNGKKIKINATDNLKLDYQGSKSGDVVSAIIYNSSGTIVKYGSLGTGISGTVNIPISDLDQSKTYKVVLFSENSTMHLASTPVVMQLSFGKLSYKISTNEMDCGETYNSQLKISSSEATFPYYVIDKKEFNKITDNGTIALSESEIKKYVVTKAPSAGELDGNDAWNVVVVTFGEYVLENSATISSQNNNTNLHYIETQIPLNVPENTGYETYTENGITWNYTVENVNGGQYVCNLHTLNGNIGQIIDANGTLKIPEKINGKNVYSIGTGDANRPFISADINSYTSVEFPTTLRKINDYAFQGNKASARISIPSTVESLGKNAFSGCNNMVSLDIDATQTNAQVTTLEIKDRAFAGMSGLKSLNITADTSAGKTSKQVTVGGQAFEDNEGLKKVTINSSVNIGENAFNRCTLIDSVNLSGLTGTISANGFAGCTSLKKLSIPNTVTLKANSFKDCTGLKELSLDVATVPNDAFANCYNINHLILGEHVAKLEASWGGTSATPLNGDAATIDTVIDVNNATTVFEMTNEEPVYKSSFMGYKNGSNVYSKRNVTVNYTNAAESSLEKISNTKSTSTAGDSISVTLMASGSKNKFTEVATKQRDGIDVFYNGKVYSVKEGSKDNRKDDKTSKYIFDKKKFSVVPTYTDASTGEESLTDFHFFNQREADAAVKAWIEKDGNEKTYMNVTENLGIEDDGQAHEHTYEWYAQKLEEQSFSQEAFNKQMDSMIQAVYNDKTLFLEATADILDEKATVNKVPKNATSTMQTLTVIYYPDSNTSVDSDYHNGEPTYYTMTADVKVVEYSEEQEFFDKGFTYASVMKEYNKLDEQTKEFESNVKDTIDSINEALGDAGQINPDDYDNVNDAYKAAMKKLQEVIAGAEEGSQTLADALKAAKEAQEAQAKAEENLKKIEAEYAKLAETYKDLLANTKSDNSGYIAETDKDGQKSYTVVIGSTIYDCTKTGKTYTDANGTYDIYTYTDDNGVKHYIYADANGVHELTIKADNIENGQIKEDITPDNKDTTLEKEPEDIESSQAVVMQRKLLAQITALSEKLNGLESSLNDIAADLSQWITGFDANAFDKLTSEEKAQKIKEAVEALNKAYTTVKADYDKLNGAYSDIANANNKLTETNNKLNTAVDAFEKLQKGQADKEALTNAYNSFNTSYSELNAVYETLNKQYETIKGVSGTIDAAVTALNNSKTQLDAVADSLTKAYNALGSDSFESAYDELNTAKGGLTASVAELNKASKELNTALEQLQGNVTNYQTALSNIRKALGLTPSSAIDVSDITAKIEELSNGFAGIDGLIKQLKDLGIDIDENADDKLDAVINAVTALNNKYTALTSDYNKIVRKIYGADDTVDLSNKTVAEILGQIDAMSGDTTAIQKQLQEALTGESVDADKAQSLGVLITQVETMRTDLTSKASLLQQIMDALGVTDSAQILQSIVTLQNKVTELEKQVANGSGSSNVDYTGIYQSGYTAGYSAGLKENVKGNDSELAKKVTELTEKTESLASENGTLKSDKANLESRVNALSSENATLQSDKANLTAQVNALNSENATLRAVNDTLNNSVSSLNSQIAALNDSNNSLQEQITALQSRVNNVNVPTATTTTTAGNKTENKATTTKATVKSETKTEEETTKAAEIKVEPATKETEEETTKAANMTAIGGVTLNKPGKTGTENSENFAANGEEEAQHSNKLAAIGAFVAGFAALAGGLAYMFVIRPKKHAVPATNFSANDEFDDEDEDLEADTEE